MNIDRSRGTSIISGRQAVAEALRSRWPVREVLISRKSARRFEEILQYAEQAGVSVVVLDDDLFRTRCPGAFQGISAVVEEVPAFEVQDLLERAEHQGEDAFLLAVDGVEDPQNLGAMARTALSMGVHGLVVPRRRVARLGQGAARASAGAVFHLPVAEVPNVHWFIRWAKENGLWVYGLDAAGSVELWRQNFAGPVAIIVGGEGRGLSRLVRESCDVLVKIPMYGPINSLNAGVAAALALYEVRRQRVLKPLSRSGASY
ncbi:MAG TPA: 23S rRNA (guanosine(2251)-2'-O)-methyltransferase RlmB [Firmicutes bacterium]|nr:23S rRNA (guanosine(2251)-2'-O)-methyltransferase RlmB [Candidatus Fermentithermobacillaceae bacterium]